MSAAFRVLAAVIATVGLLLGAPARAEDRPTWHVAMVIDQSCSMTHTDVDRTAVLAPAVFSDLSTERDRFEVLPQDGGRGASAVLEASQRGTLKQYLDGLGNWATDSDWHPTFGAAVRSLDQNRSLYDRRVLVVVYDGDVAGPPVKQIRDEVATVQAAGGQVYVIGVGSSAIGKPLPQAVGQGHAFRVDDSGDLLDAFAEILRRTLGARTVPRGQGGRTFQVTMPPGVHQAWLVALANDEVRSVRQGQGNPTAGRVSPVPGGGWTLATGRGQRGYQVLQLDAPSPGTWTFEADTAADSVEYLLLPFFDVSVSVEVLQAPVAGGTSKVRVTPSGTGVPSDVQATLRVDGREYPLTRSPDGSFTGDVPFASPGSTTIEGTVTSDDVEATAVATVDVAKADGTLDCASFDGRLVAANQTVELQLSPLGASRAPDAAWLQIRGDRVDLADDGVAPDKAAGDGVFTVRFDSGPAGVLEVIGWSRFAGTELSCKASLDVRETVALSVGPPGRLDLGPCRPDLPGTGPGPQGCVDAGCCTGVLASLDLAGTEASGPYTVQVSLAAAPPRGIEVFAATLPGKEGRLSTDRSVGVQMRPGSAELPLRFCLRRCPAAGEFDPLVVLKLDVPDAFGVAGSGELTLGGAHAEVPFHATVHPSAWWVCWGRWLLALLALLIGAFVVWGIVRPVRFPRTGQRSRIPSEFANVDLHELDRTEAFRWRPLREQRRWRFWAHERLTLVGDDLTPHPWQPNGRASLRLDRGSVGMIARLVPKGEGLYQAKWQPGVRLGDYTVDRGDGEGGDLRAVPAEGARVESNTVYYVRGGARVLIIR